MPAITWLSPCHAAEGMPACWCSAAGAHPLGPTTPLLVRPLCCYPSCVLAPDLRTHPFPTTHMPASPAVLQVSNLFTGEVSKYTFKRPVQVGILYPGGVLQSVVMWAVPPVPANACGGSTVGAQLCGEHTDPLSCYTPTFTCTHPHTRAFTHPPTHPPTRLPAAHPPHPNCSPGGGAGPALQQPQEQGVCHGGCAGQGQDQLTGERLGIGAHIRWLEAQGAQQFALFVPVQGVLDAVSENPCLVTASDGAGGCMPP